jgi:hypothetical protein
MRFLLYVAATLFGLFGVLALLRTIERVATGVGWLPSQVALGLLALLIATVCFRRARKRKSSD